jgi:hypothetical protein
VKDMFLILGGILVRIQKKKTGIGNFFKKIIDF